MLDGQVLKNTGNRQACNYTHTHGCFLQQTGNKIIFISYMKKTLNICNWLALNTFGRSYLFFFFTACSS